MRNWSTILLLAGFFLFSASDLEKEDTDAIIKANYIYNFAKLVDWPTDQKQGNFVIAVLGETNVYQELIDKYSNKLIGQQPIEVKKLSSDVTNLGKYQILYVTKGNAAAIPAICKNLEDGGTLIVAEEPSSLAKGAVIEFLVEENRLKFSLSKKNATSYGLIVGSTLSSLAKSIE